MLGVRRTPMSDTEVAAPGSTEAVQSGGLSTCAHRRMAVVGPAAELGGTGTVGSLGHPATDR